MKKLYYEDKFCRFNEYRSLKAQKKRESKNKNKKHKRGSLVNTKNEKSKKTKQNNYFAKQILIVNAPENFSIINNREEFMDFLQRFDIQAWHGKPVRIDLSNVKTITPDALLCMIAYLTRYNLNKKLPHITGNSPEDPHCKQIFRESGFYKYVISDFKHQDTENVLSIRSDVIVNPVEAAAVIQFVRNKLGITQKKITKSVFTTIMESMNNVQEHAYGTRVNQGWWLMALPENNADSDIIHFSLVDNGKSIPETIRKRWTERITTNDGDLIRAAVLENRSETRLYYRGNGLPKLKTLVDNQMIKNLYIISKKGCYFVDEDETYTMKREYFGTIITWDFIRR